MSLKREVKIREMKSAAVPVNQMEGFLALLWKMNKLHF